MSNSTVEDEFLAEEELDEVSQATIDLICEKLLDLCDVLSGDVHLRPYQREVGKRIIESIILGDGETITATQCRQCLDENTVVLNPDGSACRVKDREGSTYTGFKPTKRYRVNGGAEVTMTEDHIVMTKEYGWIAARNLKEGHHLSLQTFNLSWLGEEFVEKEIDLGGRWHTKQLVKQPVTQDLGRWLGYLTTDGSWTRGKGQSPKFTNTRREYLDEFDKITRNEFGLEPKWYSKGSGFDLLLTTSNKSVYGNNLVLNFLKALTWDAGFPTDVFKWSPEVVSRFINRAWSGDGTVTFKRRANGKEYVDVFLACGNNETYAYYWQALLQKFGIQSQVKREIMPKGTGVFHRLVLGSGEANLTRFFEVTGLIYGKETASRKALHLFHEMKSRRSLGGKGYASEPKRMYEHHGYGPDGEELGWARIVKIEDAGERHVYDPHVPGKGWLIAQGLQVSNSGKSETVANIIAICMVMLPILAKVFPVLLEKFKRGVWVGCFAPTDDQSEIVFSRVVSRLTSEYAVEFFSDPDINIKVSKGFGNTINLSNGSLVRRQTAHPRSNIEGKTYHIVLIDESQDVEERVVSKSITPMMAATNGTMIMIGTPGFTKGAFFNQIQMNKRNQLNRGKRQLHFEYTWKEVVKYDKNYLAHVKKQMLTLGEDSIEFRIAYCCEWQLDKGMFTTSERLKTLSDTSMKIVHAYNKTPVVVGIDPARKQDSTIVTVLWVDWDHPVDSTGLRDCRILNWLDLTGLDWEAQYSSITDFLSNYNVLAVGVDSGGLGDPVIQRLQVLMPRTHVFGIPSDRAEQSKRWKWLRELMQRGLIAWPGHAETRRLKIYKKFEQQMGDLEAKFDGPYYLAQAPKAANAHDDLPDSLAFAVATMMKVSEEFTDNTVEVSNSPWF